MSWSSLYVQILISIAIALGALILTIIDIVPLRVMIGLVPILILLAILRNSIDKRTTQKPLSELTGIYSYFDVLYNDVGLFVKQYYDSDNSHNNQKSKSLHEKMGEFVPLLSRHKLSIPDKLTEEITALFDMLFNYKRMVEGAISHKRDETAYKRWLAINEEFNKNVVPEIKKLKKSLQK